MTTKQAQLLMFWLLLMAISVYLYLNDKLDIEVNAIVAMLTDKQGRVEYKGPTFSVWSEASDKQAFEAGTLVSTGKDSRAKIWLASEQLLEIAEDSQIVIGDTQDFSNNENFYVNVLKGNMKLDETERYPQEIAGMFQSQNKSQQIKPKQLAIRSGEMVTTISALAPALISIQKEIRKIPSVIALKPAFSRLRKNDRIGKTWIRSIT